MIVWIVWVSCGLLVFHCCLPLCEGRYFSNTAMISKRYNRIVTPNVEFDDSGELPFLKSAAKALSRSSTILILNTNNSTIVSQHVNPESTQMGFVFGKEALIPLGNCLYIVITGIIGDAQVVIKTARQHIANHFHVYGISPTGKQLGEEIANLLQSHTRLPRPLCCHIFVIDTKGSSDNSVAPKRSLIYEIDPTGVLQVVLAGVAGKGTNYIKRLLNARFNERNHTLFSSMEAKRLAERLIIDADEQSRHEESSAVIVSSGSQQTCVIDHKEIFV